MRDGSGPEVSSTPCVNGDMPRPYHRPVNCLQCLNDNPKQRQQQCGLILFSVEANVRALKFVAAQRRIWLFGKLLCLICAQSFMQIGLHKEEGWHCSYSSFSSSNHKKKKKKKIS